MITPIYEQFYHIDKRGKALTPDGHEFRDEEGQIVYVPDYLHYLFKQITEGVV
jgi:hypothetical protein